MAVSPWRAAYIVHAEDGLAALATTGDAPVVAPGFSSRLRCSGHLRSWSTVVVQRMDDPPFQAICDSDTCPTAALHGAYPGHPSTGPDVLAVGNFSADLSPALRGYYVELKISPNGAAGLRLLTPLRTCPILDRCLSRCTGATGLSGARPGCQRVQSASE